MVQEFFTFYFLDVIDHGDKILFHHSFQNCTPFLIAPSQHLMNRLYLCFFLSNLEPVYTTSNLFKEALEIHYEMLNYGSFLLPRISIWHERFHITSSHVPRTCTTPSFDNSTHMIITSPKQCTSTFQIGNILLVVFPTPIGHFNKPSFMCYPSIVISNNIPSKEMKYRFKKGLKLI